MSLPTPLNCHCGRKASVLSWPMICRKGRPRSRVICDRGGCWRGPVRRSRLDAIRAWNVVIAAAGAVRPWFKAAR